MRELLVFVHGLSNFGHNRVTKKKQEELIEESLRGSDTQVKIYGTTGNYALVCPLADDQIRLRLLAGLNEPGRYQVKEIVVVERKNTMLALDFFVAECRRKYTASFNSSDFGVGKGTDRRRMGLVFVQGLCDLDSTRLKLLSASLNGNIEVLGIHAGVVGVLIADPPEPRIPWGVAAAFVEKILKTSGESVLATARSAKTVRGSLNLFETWEMVGRNR